MRLPLLLSKSAFWTPIKSEQFLGLGSFFLTKRTIYSISGSSTNTIFSTRHAKHAHDRNGEIKRSFGQNFGMDSGPFRYFLHFVCFLDVANREAERPLSPSSISKCYLYPLHKTAIIYTTKRTVERSFFLDRFVCICVLYHLDILVFSKSSFWLFSWCFK